MNFSYLFSLLLLFVPIVVATNQTCYQCNSADEKSSDCVSDDTKKLTRWKKTCPELDSGSLEGAAAIGCRKIIQKIEDDPDVVVRECAYSGEDADGVRKAGNMGVHIYYYQCTNEKASEPCNGIPAVASLSTILLTAAIMRCLR